MHNLYQLKADLQVTKQPPRLALVVPCFNEEKVLSTTIGQLRLLIGDLIKKNSIDHRSYVAYVDDGSTDNTWNIIESEANSNYNCVGIMLTINVGHQNALLAGLHYVSDKCDISISLDSDLQDDISVIEQMIDLYEKGNDIVLGVRRNRNSDTYFKKTTAKFFYKLISTMGVKTLKDHADYRLMSRSALINLKAFKETNLYLRGFPFMLSKKIGVVEYDRLERLAGETKYTLFKMLSLAWNGISSFSVVPLRIITVTGALIFFASLLMSLFSFVSYMHGDNIPGWTSIVIPMYFLGGIIMLSIGILGEYIGKVFIESKERPRYFYEQIIHH